MVTSLCLSQSLSWKILTSENMMIYMGNGNSLSDPKLYRYSIEYAITKTQSKEENTNMHVSICLCTDICTWVHIISPLSSIKVRNRRGLSSCPEDLVPSRLGQQDKLISGGPIQNSVALIIKSRLSVGFLYGYLLQMLLMYLWSCPGKCLFAGSKCKFNSNTEHCAAPECTWYWGERHGSVILLNHWQELGLFTAITGEKNQMMVHTTSGCIS